MIYDYGPANFGDTNGNYVSYSPAAQQQTDLSWSLIGCPSCLLTVEQGI